MCPCLREGCLLMLNMLGVMQFLAYNYDASLLGTLQFQNSFTAHLPTQLDCSSALPPWWVVHSHHGNEGQSCLVQGAQVAAGSVWHCLVRQSQAAQRLGTCIAPAQAAAHASVTIHPIQDAATSVWHCLVRQSQAARRPGTCTAPAPAPAHILASLTNQQIQ
jgi:hypothetical protein